eukprot:5528803-Pleurochrysis_carterae.AAC.2
MSARTHQHNLALTRDRTRCLGSGHASTESKQTVGSAMHVARRASVRARLLCLASLQQHQLIASAKTSNCVLPYAGVFVGSMCVETGVCSFDSHYKQALVSARRATASGAGRTDSLWYTYSRTSPIKHQMTYGRQLRRLTEPRCRDARAAEKVVTKSETSPCARPTLHETPTHDGGTPYRDN